MTLTKYPTTIDEPLTTEEQLRLKVAKLQSENRRLYRKLPDSPKHIRRLDRAYNNAKIILLNRFSGIATSRQTAANLGITQRAWSDAIALLKVATVYYNGDVQCTELTEAISLLDGTYDSIRQSGNITRLINKLPLSLR